MELSDPLLLARLQFAFTISFHIVFPAFSIGLASYLAVLNGLWLWTGQAAFLDLFISKAYADDGVPARDTASQPMRVAQASMEVVCQSKTKDSVIRVVKDGGKCFRETVSLFKGTVEKREEVPCNTQCTH